jgi:hypothetical protein
MTGTEQSAGFRCPATAHPRVAELTDYWSRIHPAQGLPGRQHFDPVDVRRLLPDIWMLDVHRDPLRFRYRLVGTAIVTAVGREITGQWIEKVFANWEPKDAPYRRYKAVLETGVPSWRRGAPFNADRARCPVVENIVLPLATDGSEIDILLGLTIYSWTDAPSVWPPAG